jgi:uncharacterized membrane protein
MDTSTHQKNTLLAILAYIGPLVIVSLIVSNRDPFVKFHIKQGLVLLLIEVILWVFVSMFFWQIGMIWPIIDLIDLAIFVFCVVGVVNASQGKEKELPYIGAWGRNFPI